MMQDKNQCLSHRVQSSKDKRVIREESKEDKRDKQEQSYCY